MSPEFGQAGFAILSVGVILSMMFDVRCLFVVVRQLEKNFEATKPHGEQSGRFGPQSIIGRNDVDGRRITKGAVASTKPESGVREFDTIDKRGLFFRRARGGPRITIPRFARGVRKPRTRHTRTWIARATPTTIQEH